MATKKFSKGEALRFGWKTMKENFWFFVGLLLFVFALYLVLGIVEGMTKDRYPWIALIVNIVSLILQLLIGMGAVRMTLKFCDNEKGKFSDLFNCFPLLLKYLSGSFVYGVIVLLGMLLLIIPGIIWAIQYQFFNYLIVDQGLGPLAAIKKSGALTKGSRWDLFTFGLLLGGVNLLGVLCLLLGLFATVPATMIAAAFVYRKLLTASEATQGAVAPQPT